MTVRTRFAPSPTGYLHVGGARTALFNWLYARKHNGKFILRVEDTDQARNTEAARKAIFDGLTWLGLDWDEGPESPNPSPDGTSYYQSQRKEIYDTYFEKLLAADRLYKDGDAYRFRFDRKPITMNDLVCGEVTIDYRDESNTPDMVVRRSDGSYVFHFVNVVDDLEMKMSHVIRGEDHLMNTPKHLQLIEAFGATPPQYAHIPLILNPNGSKMSKRDEGAAVHDYPKQGFLPQAVVNFIALLGWSSKTDEEIFTLTELIDRFSLENVNRSPGRFDLEKCTWVNQQHIAKITPEEFATLAQPFVETAGLPISESYPTIVGAVKDKLRLLSEVPNAIDFLVLDEITQDPEALTKAKTNPNASHLIAVANEMENITEWNADAAKRAITAVATANGTKMGQLMFPTRVALSGRSGGPDLGDIFEILGKEKTISRLRNF
ncbi:glutamate--tRNA ligase [Luteolibacter sp. AS25]|uniref:glutamate--tRNA ligase n=1 Tax=Luteolibacter sp. AS25 TaxID=3135776 RepID=UPI00398AFF5B